MECKGRSDHGQSHRRHQRPHPPTQAPCENAQSHKRAVAHKVPSENAQSHKRHGRPTDRDRLEQVRPVLRRRPIRAEPERALGQMGRHTMHGRAVMVRAQLPVASGKPPLHAIPRGRHCWSVRAASREGCGCGAQKRWSLATVVQTRKPEWGARVWTGASNRGSGPGRRSEGLGVWRRQEKRTPIRARGLNRMCMVHYGSMAMDA